MKVDVHTHVWKAEHWSPTMIEEASIARGCPADIDIKEEDHWEAMKAVDRAFVFGFRARHSGLVVPNDLIASYVAQHPAKLIGFACLDPWDDDYLDEMHRCFEGLNFKGLKLAPIYQNYHPMDERMQPVYKYCERRGIPVLFHQGTTFVRRAPLKYAQPAQLEDLAMEYPDLKMIIAHMGHPWIDETIVLIRKQPNMYADISALYYRPWQFYNALMSAVEYGAHHKLLLGSDYGYTTPADTICNLRKVNHIVGNSGLPTVPSEVIETLIERDAVKLLGLE
jgi:predicted TIM-barrel fold metal-dependent hydrolase